MRGGLLPSVPGLDSNHCLHVPAQIDGEDGRCSRGRASGFRAHLSSGTGLAGPWVVLGTTIWQPAWPLPPTLEPTVTVPARRRVSSPSLCKACVTQAWMQGWGGIPESPRGWLRAKHGQPGDAPSGAAPGTQGPFCTFSLPHAFPISFQKETHL